MEIRFTTCIFKEERTYVAHALELDVSSCGASKEKALKNLKEAVRLFLEEAEKMGTPITFNSSSPMRHANSARTAAVHGFHFVKPRSENSTP